MAVVEQGQRDATPPPCHNPLHYHTTTMQRSTHPDGPKRPDNWLRLCLHIGASNLFGICFCCFIITSCDAPNLQLSTLAIVLFLFSSCPNQALPLFGIACLNLSWSTLQYAIHCSIMILFRFHSRHTCVIVIVIKSQSLSQYPCS